MFDIDSNSVAEPEPVLFGRSRYFSAGAGVKVRLRLPAPVSGSSLEKTDEILNDIIFVCSNFDKMLIKKQVLRHKLIFSSKEKGMVPKKNFFQEFKAYFS